jgi:uncharacterized protein RhaS with RHS repeats
MVAPWLPPQWNVNRWYSPAIQRWMSEDPFGFAGGNANLNRYVGNAPNMVVDPSGMLPADGSSRPFHRG